MKKYFTTGLAILLPIVLTVMIVRFFINLLTKPFLGSTEAILDHYHLLFSDTSGVHMISKGLILLTLVFVILMIGLIGRYFLFAYFFRFSDYLLHQLPVVNKVYKGCQDVVNSIFSSSSKSFSQVVLVPFPSSGALSVGLVTRESISVLSQHQTTDMIPVFVPGTPNPSVGFMLMFKQEQLIFVNMKIEEALKFVVSCGVVMPPFAVTPAVDLSSNKP